MGAQTVHLWAHVGSHCWVSANAGMWGDELVGVSVSSLVDSFFPMRKET